MSIPLDIGYRSFLDYLKFQKRYSRHTIVSYQNDLEGFQAFMREEMKMELDVSEVKAMHIRAWMAHMKDQGITAKTINRKISALKSFFKFQLREQQVTLSPVTGIITPKISKRLPKYVEKEDLRVLFKDVEFSEGFEGKTQRLALEILYNTGIRQAELLNMKDHHIDAANSSIKVLGKGNKERVIPMGRILAASIADYCSEKKKEGLSSGEGHLLVNRKGAKLYPKYLYNLTIKYLSKVTTSEKRSPHVLRHSFATHLTNNGADLNAVKELLGHSSLAATQVYTHNNIEKLKEIHKRAHPKA